jgi:hypothetical protein
MLWQPNGLDMENGNSQQNVITWPGIDLLSIDKHLPKSIASAKGRLDDQERKNLQSTKPVIVANVDGEFSQVRIPQTPKPLLRALPWFLSCQRTPHTMTSREDFHTDRRTAMSIYLLSVRP